MYMGALMPPNPISPMKSPWPIQSGQGGPMVEIARPRPIIKDPQITVHRVPTLSAILPIRMPPKPEPSQARALASAGIDRIPSTSAAMSLSATAAIHAAPNAISIVTSATVATVQDGLLSIEEGSDCNIMGSSRRGTFLAAPAAFDYPHRRRSALCAALRQNARSRRPRKFPFASGGNNEIDPNLLRCSFSPGGSALCHAQDKPI